MKLEILQNGRLVDAMELKEGNYKIGRTQDNDIQLKSVEVSKHHGVLLVKAGKVAIVDSGSANGIFVNGVLVKKQKIHPGDEVGIAEFSLRVSKGPLRSPPPAPIRSTSVSGNLAQNLDYENHQEHSHGLPGAQPDVSPQEKLMFLVDQKLLSPLYQLMGRFDWRVLLASILAFTLVLSVALSVLPIFRWGKSIATQESLNRAHTVVGQMVRENYRILVKSGEYTRLTVEAAEAEPGILSAIIVDPNSKSVLAPATLLNKTVSGIYSLVALKKIMSGEQDVVSVDRNDGTYVVAQPIYLFTQKNERQLGAIVLAEFEVPSGIFSTLEPLIEAALFSVLLSLIAYFIIMKMVSHPVVKIGEQLDAALKGESVQVKCDIKFPELETLASEINFCISRWKQLEASGGGQHLEQRNKGEEEENYLLSVQEFDSTTGDALLVLDAQKTVRFVGHVAEELFSMKPQYAVGQNITAACSDGGFVGTAVELSERVIHNFGQLQTAEQEIHGVNRGIAGVGHKDSTGELAFVIITVKMNNG